MRVEHREHIQEHGVEVRRRKADGIGLCQKNLKGAPRLAMAERQDLEDEGVCGCYEDIAFPAGSDDGGHETPGSRTGYPYTYIWEACAASSIRLEL